MSGNTLLSVNGFPCVRGRIVLPLTGAWVADVVADPDNDIGTFPNPGTPVTMSYGQQSFQGVVRRASAPFGTTFARLIGGAGGLPSTVPAMGYMNTTVQQVLTDLLNFCGETLAPNSDPTITNQNLPSWTRIAGYAWKALANLMGPLDPKGTWRVLPNGQVWVGVDKFPLTTLQDFDLLSYLPQELRAEIYTTNPTILPGQSFMGGNVTSIEHIIEPAKIFSTVLFADAQLASVEAV